jgi:hypothetical protein
LETCAASYDLQRAITSDARSAGNRHAIVRNGLVLACELLEDAMSVATQLHVLAHSLAAQSRTPSESAAEPCSQMPPLHDDDTAQTRLLAVEERLTDAEAEVRVCVQDVVDMRFLVDEAYEELRTRTELQSANQSSRIQ